MSKLVQIVTVSNKVKLYKSGEEASNIELIQFKENGFEVVAQKGLYELDDSAVYIQPDTCVPNNNLFKEFIEPNGDMSKSKLGKIESIPARVRAIKFNFNKENSTDKIFSNGILLPSIKVVDYLYLTGKYDNVKLEDLPIDSEEALGLYKYEKPEKFDKDLTKGAKGLVFPKGLYKTDETNINNVWDNLTFPITLIGTVKKDGSSVTVGFTMDEGAFICSRNLRLPLEIKEVVGKRKKTFLEYLMFWKKVDLNIYESKVNDKNAFVKYGMPYLQLLMSNDLVDTVLRGELCGEGVSKGSGNKVNKNAKEKPNIKFFTLDIVNNKGMATKAPHFWFKKFTETWQIPTVEEVFHKEFKSKEELVNECELYFKDNLVEGLVIRNEESTFSAKYMNNEYDSKK